MKKVPLGTRAIHLTGNDRRDLVSQISNEQDEFIACDEVTCSDVNLLAMALLSAMHSALVNKRTGDITHDEGNVLEQGGKLDPYSIHAVAHTLIRFGIAIGRRLERGELKYDPVNPDDFPENGGIPKDVKF